MTYYTFWWTPLCMYAKLMFYFIFQCNCTGDTYCEQSKQNVQSCQKEVMYATREDTIVSCSAAQWICAADPLCSTALEYYNRFCQAMFRGKKCSDRCMNSIGILRRQPKASKLGNFLKIKDRK